MGRKFAKIAPKTHEMLQIGSAIILTSFDPETGTFNEEDMLGSTGGGVTVSLIPAFVDLGEGIDNCPRNTKELKDISAWAANVTSNFMTVNSSSATRLLAAADESDGTITPRMNLKGTDFHDLWIVGSLTSSEDAFIAIHLKQTLSVDGFRIQTGDRAKGQFAFNFAAHYTMEDPDSVPFDLYLSKEA